MFTATCVCVLALLACGKGDSNMDPTTFAAKTFMASLAGCNLTVELDEADRTRVRLRYTFTNGSDGVVYFFDQLQGEYHNGVLDFGVLPEVYTEVEEDGVVLSKKVQTIPPGGAWPEWPDGPYATRVPPGKSEMRNVTFALPVRSYNPHVSMGMDPFVAGMRGRPTYVTKLPAWFEVAFVAVSTISDEYRTAHSQSRATDGRIYYNWELSHPEQQLFLRVGPIAELPIRSGAPLR